MGIFLSTLAAGPYYLFNIPSLLKYTAKTQNAYSVAATSEEIKNVALGREPDQPIFPSIHNIAVHYNPSNKEKGTNKLDESNNIKFEYNSLVSTEKQGQNAVPDCISSIQNQSIVKNDKNKIDFILKIEAQDNRLLEEANNRYNYYMGVSLGFLALALVYVFFTHTKLKNMYYLV